MNRQIEFTTHSASTMRFSRKGIRMLSAALIAVCSFVWYTPSVYAAVHEWQPEPEHGLASFSPLAAGLVEIRERLREMEKTKQSGAADKNIQTLLDKGKSRFALWHELRDFKKQDAAYRKQRQHQFEQARLSGLQQHAERIQASTALYVERADQLAQSLALFLGDQWGQGTDAPAYAAALSLLTPFIERPYQSYGNDLDFIEPPPRSMFTSQTEIETLVGQSGDPGLADLAYLETDDATQASVLITNLISQIGTDPITLYNWVYDNIRWLPQYGLMQSADYTFQAQQGNAFDIASLLIALLRESGYPARYVYGAVAVDPAELRNWVGDVINNDAAINLLSQGGVPQQIGTLGGAEVEMQLEHVWAQVKFNGQWVDLDASFKTMEYTEGVDLQAQVPFDAQGLVSQLEASATSNETEGWVQGVDSALIESTLNDYQTQLEGYIDTNLPNATLGDVLGLANIIPSQALSLDEAHQRFVRTLASQPLQHLPDNLKYHFQYQVGSVTGGDFGTPVQWATELAELSDSTPYLLGQSIALSFSPATAADQALLESYLPGTINTVEDLPDSLPAGDVQIVGEITLDGAVVATTPAQPLGAILMTRSGFIGPSDSPASSGTWRFTENNLVVGQYQAIGIDMQGLSPGQLESLQARLENTQAALEAEDFTGLSKHEVTGDLLQAGIQGYLATTYAMDRIAAQAADMIYLRRPSYGTFSTQLNVSYTLGIPQSVQFSGLVMDADRISMNTEHQENCYDDWIAFNRSSGMRNSALEHEIPEQLFSTDEDPAEGVSTAKALAIASAEGQRIYTLTQENQSQLANITIEEGARDQIQAALDAGLEVTVHESPITVNGWTGSGYTLIDAEYGVGAYQISGSISGGVMPSESEAAKFFSRMAVFGGLVAALFSLPLAALVFTAVSVFAVILDVFSRCPNGGGANLILSAGIFGILAAIIGFVFATLTPIFALALFIGVARFQSSIFDLAINRRCS